MSWFLSLISSGLGKFIFGLLDMYMRKLAKDEEMTKSYHEFLAQIDKSGAVKVTQYLAAEDALKAKQDELRKQLEAEK